MFVAFKRKVTIAVGLSALLLLLGLIACGGGDSSSSSASSDGAAAETEQEDQTKDEYQASASAGTTFTTTPTAVPATGDKAEASAEEVVDDFKVGDRRLVGGIWEIKYGEPQYGGIMQVQHLSSIVTWDPHVRINTPLYSPSYNSLLQFNPWTFDRFDIIGDLATSWEQTDAEGLVWTFEINPDATSWDGTPFNAHDIVYSFERGLGVDEYRQKKDYEMGLYVGPHLDYAEALDDHTVRLHLLHTWADFLGYMADDAIQMVPKHHFEMVDQKDDEGKWDIMDGYKNIMGSGPFMPSSVTDKSTWSYVKNPIYWKKDPDGRGLPYLDGMDYFVITDRTAARAAWEADQVWNTNWQTNGNMNPADMKDMIERGGDKFVAYPAACCPDGYALDITTAPFNDIRVRQAVSLAIDRQATNELVWGGLGVLSTPAGPAVHPLTMDEDELLTIPGWRRPKDQDIARAKELLAEAGYPDGFATTLITGNTLSDQDKGPVLADQLKRALNIEVEQIVLERLAKEEARNKGGYDMMTWGSGAGVITPDQYLYKFYALDNLTGNPLDWKYEGEEDLLALIDQQSAELDPVKRKAIVREIELITMTKDSHFIVVFNRTFARLFNAEKVGGQNPTQSGYAETKAEQLWLLNP